jgi:hypothetical protein
MFTSFRQVTRCDLDLESLLRRSDAAALCDTACRSGLNNLGAVLPDDSSLLFDYLRRERYLPPGGAAHKSAVRRLYYLLRPLLPVGIRKHLQRLALRDWQSIPFPAWPLDTTVDDLVDGVWRILLRESGEERLPFVWYWPDGHRCAGMMTHDVETAAGRDFSGDLMAMEQKAGIVSAFEIVPEKRYAVPPEYLDSIREGGCEICLHGLNHDGHLFEDEAEFKRRAARINGYMRDYGARGFRSPIMYRRQDWLHHLDIAFDMSVPNTARLDPQRGGCCTIFPYFVGDIIELPLTMIQDYSLYNVLGDYSTEIWRRQAGLVRERHGLASFIIHPEYTRSRRTADLYRELLDLLAAERDDRGMWVALPGEVERWWRQRDGMSLERNGGGWVIRGDGAERARLAWALLDGDELRYEVSP